MYISRKDGDVVTYDLRFRRPNLEPVLSNAVSHSLEHLMATSLRNGKYSGKVIYFGPMGCRTGFYFLMRSESPEEAIDAVRLALGESAAWDGPLPGADPRECGNWREHDLEGAKAEAGRMLSVLKDWDAGKLNYLP